MTIAQQARASSPRRIDGLARRHLRGLAEVLAEAERHAPTLERWGTQLAARLSRGHRVLVAGNGGSAAEAQHLTAELVGRFRDDRPAYSAIALNAESSSLTAIGNDYGFSDIFARQVRAHARAGDIVMLLSTSGTSDNLLHAAHAAHEVGATTWALTGEGPNPLAGLSDESICLDGEAPHVQECQPAAIHALCVIFDAIVGTDAS